MKCHIIPITYFEPWSIAGTMNASRNKRKIYIFNKNKINDSSKPIKTIKINEIWKENCYILDINNPYHRNIVQHEIMECVKKAPAELGLAGLTYIQIEQRLSEEGYLQILKYLINQLGDFDKPEDGTLVKSIEEFFCHGCEQRWKDFVNDANKFILRGNTVKEKGKDNLLEFVAIQYYRKDRNISNNISLITSWIEKILPITDISTDKYIKSKFVGILYDYKKYKENEELYLSRKGIIPPIARTIFVFNLLQVSFIKSPTGHKFITSDSPVYIVDKSHINTGIYMPVSPKICLFLFKSVTTLKDKYKILDATINLVKFINGLTLTNSTEIVLSNEELINDNITENFPRDEFIEMMSNAGITVDYEELKDGK